MRTIKILGLSLVGVLVLLACEKETEVSAETATIADLTCPGAVFSGNASAGTSYNGVFTVPYTGGDGGDYTSGDGVSSIGVSGLSAIRVPGTLALGAGMLTYTVVGTPYTNGMASFVITFGGQSCTVAMPVMAGPTAPEPVGE